MQYLESQENIEGCLKLLQFCFLRVEFLALHFSKIPTIISCTIISIIQMMTSIENFSLPIGVSAPSKTVKQPVGLLED